MNRRLRKKKRVGEFRELGFPVRLCCAPGLTNSDRNALLDSFIEEAIESSGLQFGGGGAGDTWEGFAALNAPRGSASESHRQAVNAWLEQHPQVQEHTVGPLTDANYGH